MKTIFFVEAAISERNRAGQGVQRELTTNDIPAEILALLQLSATATKK